MSGRSKCRVRAALARLYGLSLLGLLAGGQLAWAAEAVDEVLRLVPREMAACLVIEDLAGHYERLQSSAILEKVTQLAPVRTWQASKEYRSLLQVQTVLPLFLGISFEDFRDKILGQAVVLAFRPAGTAEENDVGILFCRATDSTLLANLLEAVARESGGKRREKRSHRAVTYTVVIEPNGKQQFFVQLGCVAALSDKEAAIHRVIESQAEHRSLAEDPIFQEMRSATPKQSFLQLYVLPRALDRVLARSLSASGSAQAPAGQLLDQCWKSLSWTSFTLRFAAGVEVGWHFQLKLDQLPSALQQFARLSESAADFWDLVPANALAAMVSRWDFTALADLAGRLAAGKKNDELAKVASVFNQLLAGFDLWRDLLPALGPELGILVLPGDDPLAPAILALLKVKNATTNAAGGWTLSLALETALRPLLVVGGVEHNRERGDRVVASLQQLEDLRIHYLSGSQKWPEWFQPAFALCRGYLVFGNAPGTILHWSRRATGSFKDSPVARSLAQRLPSGAVLSLFIDVATLRQSLEPERSRLVDRLIQGHGERRPKAEQQFDLLLTFMGFIDYVVIESHGDARASHWTLALLASK